MAAAEFPLPDDFITDWLDELERVAAAAATLSPVARAAVVGVIDSFAAADGSLSEAAAQARMVIAGAAAGPAPSLIPGLATDPLLADRTVRGSLLPRPVQAAA